MNYFNFIKNIVDISKKHKLVNSATEGDIYEYLNSKENKYACVAWTTDSATVQDEYMTVTGNLIYADRLLTDSSNKLDIQSAAVTTLQEIIDEIKNNGADISSEVITITPYTEKFADLCAGAYINVSFTFLTDVICDENDFDVNTISITKNGEYDVTGYDKAEVDVLPTSTSIMITKNGTYLPKDYGVDAFDKVEVKVENVFDTEYIMVNTYIPTGIRVNDANYSFEMGVVPLDLGENFSRILGVSYPNANTVQIGRYGGTNSILFGYYKLPIYQANNSAGEKAQFEIGKYVEVKLDSHYGYVGKDYKTQVLAQGSPSNYEVTINNPKPHTTVFNLYYIRIYHDDELVFEGIPKEIVGYGKALVDTVTNKILYIEPTTQLFTTLEAQPNNYINLSVTEEEYNKVMPIIEDMRKEQPETGFPIITE